MRSCLPENIRVLVVDDDTEFRAPVVQFLRRRSLLVRDAATLDDIPRLMSEFRPHVVVLDINLPDGCGFSAAHHLRQATSVGVILLSARSTADDRVHGRSVGADSYLTKPVDLRELEATIRNLHRRVTDHLDEAPPQWVFDAGAGTLTSPDGRGLRLTDNEQNLVSVLVATPGTPVNRDALLQAMNLDLGNPEDRRPDLTVSRLRRKAAEHAVALPIRAVRNVGYLFSQPARIIDAASAPQSRNEQGSPETEERHGDHV